MAARRRERRTSKTLPQAFLSILEGASIAEDEGKWALWTTLMNRYEGPERFIAGGRGVSFVGAVGWVRSAATGRDATLASTFALASPVFAAVAWIIVVRRKRER
jgi:hypothetical protein